MSKKSGPSAAKKPRRICRPLFEIGQVPRTSIISFQDKKDNLFLLPTYFNSLKALNKLKLVLIRLCEIIYDRVATL